MYGLYALLIVCVFASGFATNYILRSTVIVQTHTIRVEKSWGHPDQSVAAAQVSPQLAQLGITVCDYYASRHTLVCH